MLIELTRIKLRARPANNGRIRSRQLLALFSRRIRTSSITVLTRVSIASTPAELTSDNGGAGDDYLGTIFDDEAATAIQSWAMKRCTSSSPIVW